MVQVLAIVLAFGNFAGGRGVGPRWVPAWILVIFVLAVAGLWLEAGVVSKDGSDPTVGSGAQ